MEYQVLPHPTLPDLRILRFADGSAQTIPASLALQNSGAMAQNMSVDPGVSRQPMAADVAPNFTPAAPAAPATPPQSAPPPANSPAGEAGPAPKFDPGQALASAAMQEALNPYKYQAGTAGNVDKYGRPLQKIEVPQTKASAVQGATAYDPEGVAKFQRAQMEAAYAKSEADKKAAQTSFEASQLESVALQKEAERQAAEQRGLEENFNNKLAGLQAQATAAAGEKINPNRMFDNMSAFGKIGLVLAAAAGGYANPRGPNQIMQMVDSMVNDDIRAQEDALRAKRGTVDNALARMAREWGSIEAGRIALKMAQKEAVISQIRTAANEVGTQTAMQNADVYLKGFAAEQEQQRYELWQRSQGVLASETRASMETPTRGSAGGWVPKTGAEKLKGLDTAATVYKTAGGAAKDWAEWRGEGGKSATDRRVNFAQREYLSKSLSGLSDYERRINDVVSSSGAEIAPDGSVTFPNGAPAGLGGPLQVVAKMFGENVAGMMTDESGRLNRAKLQSVLSARIHEMSGAAFTKAEADSHAMQIGAGLLESPETLVRKMAVLQKDVAAKRRHVEAAADPEVLEEYWDNYRAAEANSSKNAQYVRRPYAPAPKSSNAYEESELK